MQVRGGHIAMNLLQEPMTSLNPVFTVGDQIVEAIRLARPSLGYDEAYRRAVEALAEVRIERPELRAEEYPHRLSGGQRQRVMIAMAIACRPELLIADEPTTALDVTVQAEILSLMQELKRRRGMSLFFITHDFGVVAQIADGWRSCAKGAIVETGALEDVLGRPAHEYTRQLPRRGAGEPLPERPDTMAQRRRDARMRRRRPRRGRRCAPAVPSETRVSLGARASRPQRTAGPPLLMRARRPCSQERRSPRRWCGSMDWRCTSPCAGACSSARWTRAGGGRVDLRIRRGQILALVGESGCGKTTLGRAVLRLVEPTGGRVHFDGRELTGLTRREMRPMRRRLQFVFQDPASSLNPRLTVATALTEPMAAHGIGENREERLGCGGADAGRGAARPRAPVALPHEFSVGSASASASPARSACVPTSWCATRSPAHSTSRCRPKCCNSCWTCDARRTDAALHHPRHRGGGIPERPHRGHARGKNRRARSDGARVHRPEHPPTPAGSSPRCRACRACGSKDPRVPSRLDDGPAARRCAPAVVIGASSADRPRRSG